MATWHEAFRASLKKDRTLTSLGCTPMSRQKEFEQILHRRLARLATRFPTAKVHAVHLLYGGLDTPGSTRYSGVEFSPAKATAIDELAPEEQKTLQNSAFQSYVHSLERSNLLVSFAEMLSVKEDSGQLVIFFHYCRRGARLWQWHRFEKRGNTIYSLNISETILESLCPPGIEKRFITAILNGEELEAQEHNASQTGLTEDLRYCRYRTQAILLERNSKRYKTSPANMTRLLPDVTASRDCDASKELTLSFLQGLQGSLLFQLAAAGKGGLIGNAALLSVLKVCSLDVVPNEGTEAGGHRESDREEAVRLLALSSPVIGRETSTRYFLPVLFADLRSDPDDPDDLQNVCQICPPTRSARPEDSEVSKQIEGAIDKASKGAFWISQQADYGAVITTYLTALLGRLLDSKHEGESLDFWFVVGNLSEFRDSPFVDDLSFDLIRGQLEQERQEWKRAFDGLAVPLKAGWQSDTFSQGARTLVGEHFPWFQGGRYALFYDASGLTGEENDDKCFPAALVRLRASSWEAYARLALSKSSSTHLPASLVVFRSAADRLGGILATERTEEGRPHQVELIARTAFGRLQTTDEQHRRKVLGKFLKECEIQSSGTLEDIVAMVIRIAENPSRGGILVILSRDATDNEFVPLGRPWNFSKVSSDPWDDIEALVSHDGATMVRPNKSGDGVDWIFRQLLTADAIKECERGRVRKVLSNAADDPGSPLRGAGSRRWSGALTAFCPGVAGVVVVSQDGDINLWRRQDESGGSGNGIRVQSIVLRLGSDDEQEKSFGERRDDV